MTQTAKHTTERWKYTRNDQACVFFIDNKPTSSFADELAITYTEAHAKLIAAAPDMAEALELLLLESAFIDGCPNEKLDKARAALAKAGVS